MKSNIQMNKLKYEIDTLLIFPQVFDGQIEDETVLGTYCGTYRPHVTHISSMNQLTVIFVSDYTIVGTGFNATYEIGIPLNSHFYSKQLQL